MPELVITIIVAFAAFVLFGIGISLSILLGKRKTRRCACSAAKEVMRQYEEMQVAKKNAENYKPENVNPHNLPLVNKR
ncbi:MAG: hypothetical protein ACRC2T_05585 [Thermoguttaceae bacterium]